MLIAEKQAPLHLMSSLNERAVTVNKTVSYMGQTSLFESGSLGMKGHLFIQNKINSTVNEQT